MYTVKQAAHMTGVAPSTVRAWEQRYSVITPARSASGYRLYDDGAIRRLRLMSTLISAGWSAAQAAERVKESGDEELTVDPNADSTAFPDPEVLVDAAVRLDGTLLTHALDEAFSLAGFEHTVRSWVLPAVVGVGRAWEDGRITIAGEHFVTAALQRRISTAYEAAGVASAHPRVLVGLPARCRHELGALVFATLVRRQHVAARYLGEDLPAQEWVTTVSALAPTAVVIVVPTPSDVPHATETVARLREAHPSLLVFTGGQCQDDVPGATPLGHDIVEAAASLAQQVNTAASPA